MQIINPTPSAVYNGMIQGTYRIASGEGILSLWRGMSSVVVGAGKPEVHRFSRAAAMGIRHLSLTAESGQALLMPSTSQHMRPSSI